MYTSRRALYYYSSWLCTDWTSFLNSPPVGLEKMVNKSTQETHIFVNVTQIYFILPIQFNLDHYVLICNTYTVLIRACGARFHLGDLASLQPIQKQFICYHTAIFYLGQKFIICKAAQLCLIMALVEECALQNAIKIELEGDILMVIIHSQFCKNLLMMYFELF